MVRQLFDMTFAALEISTAAFSTCAFITCIAEWAKIQDVGPLILLGTDAVVSLAMFSLIAQAALNISLLT